MKHEEFEESTDGSHDTSVYNLCLDSTHRLYPSTAKIFLLILHKSFYFFLGDLLFLTSMHQRLEIVLIDACLQ